MATDAGDCRDDTLPQKPAGDDNGPLSRTRHTAPKSHSAAAVPGARVRKGGAVGTESVGVDAFALADTHTHRATHSRAVDAPPRDARRATALARTPMQVHAARTRQGDVRRPPRGTGTVPKVQKPLCFRPLSEVWRHNGAAGRSHDGVEWSGRTMTRRGGALDMPQECSATQRKEGNGRTGREAGRSYGQHSATQCLPRPREEIPEPGPAQVPQRK